MHAMCFDYISPLFPTQPSPPCHPALNFMASFHRPWNPSKKKILEVGCFKNCLVGTTVVKLGIKPRTLYVEASALSVSHTHILGIVFLKASHVFLHPLKPSVYVCNIQLLSIRIGARPDMALPE